MKGLKDKFKKNMEKRKVTIKSAHPELYPDMEIECLFIPNGEINDYLASIPEEERSVGYKSAPVLARVGEVGEVVVSRIERTIDGRVYYFNEETATVKSRPYGNGERPDMVVKNVASSGEVYVVRREKFKTIYEEYGDGIDFDGWYSYIPVPEERDLTRVPENVMIETAWGATALVLAGGFIVTYNAEQNDFNVLDEEAYKATYTPVKGKKLIKTVKKPTDNE